jgi:hypothetical protein
MTKRTLEERLDFMEQTVGKLWEEIYNLQARLDKVKA